MLALVREQFAEMGRPVHKVPTGGGSDANVFRGKGIEMLNLGVGMTKVHGKQEEIAIEQIEKAAELLFRVAKA